jgi:hypothetical protein
MKHWPEPSTQADKVYTSGDLATCITDCDMVAGNDVRKVSEELAIPDGMFKERATVGQCNQHLGLCVLGCQNNFSEAIEDWDANHDES